MDPVVAAERIAELENKIRQLEATQSTSTSNSHSPPLLRLGDLAPNFSAITQLGPFNLYDFLDGHWGILFSHPADFTPVCTSELARAAQLYDELERRHVKICALSVDTIEHHLEWIKDIEQLNQTKLTYPIIADTSRKVSVLYNMLQHEPANVVPSALPLTVRSVHIIGSDRKLKTMIMYPASTGRSFDELLRVIDSLQLSEKYKIATPCGWRQGESCMVLPSISDAEAKTLFPKGVTIIRPWLRTTPFPE